MVKLYCSSEYSGIMTWFRKQGNQELQELSEEEGHISKTWNGSLHTLTIRSIQYEDNGIYFCKQQCNSANLEIAWGCGSELKVLGVCKADLGSCSHPYPRPSPACLQGEVAMAIEFPGELLGSRS